MNTSTASPETMTDEEARDEVRRRGADDALYRLLDAAGQGRWTLLGGGVCFHEMHSIRAAVDMIGRTFSRDDARFTVEAVENCRPSRRGGAVLSGSFTSPDGSVYSGMTTWANDLGPEVGPED
jgi:hypothetical protein